MDATQDPDGATTASAPANAHETHLHQQLVYEPTLVVRESSMVRRSAAARRGSA